MILSKD